MHATTVLAGLLSAASCFGAEASTASSSGAGLHGRIQGVSTSNFSMGIREGHRRRHGVRPIFVHYDPQTADISVDGQKVQALDAADAGMYVMVVGSLKNGVFEATGITVTSTPPAHHRKGKASA